MAGELVLPVGLRGRRREVVRGRWLVGWAVAPVETLGGGINGAQAAQRLEVPEITGGMAVDPRHGLGCGEGGKGWHQQLRGGGVSIPLN